MPQPHDYYSNSKYRVPFALCVCRADTRQRAFESPDPGEWFKYPHHGCRVPRKFFTGPRSSGSQVFGARVGKIQKFLEVKKVDSGGQNDLKKYFFLNTSEVFGT